MGEWKAGETVYRCDIHYDTPRLAVGLVVNKPGCDLDQFLILRWDNCWAAKDDFEGWYRTPGEAVGVRVARLESNYQERRAKLLALVPEQAEG